MSPSMMVKETLGLGSGSPQCSVGKAMPLEIAINWKPLREKHDVWIKIILCSISVCGKICKANDGNLTTFTPQTDYICNRMWGEIQVSLTWQLSTG